MNHLVYIRHFKYQHKIAESQNKYKKRERLNKSNRMRCFLPLKHRKSACRSLVSF
nr:MAG TPA: hypothetical protein [Caudoviricetes sp.]